MDDLRPEFLMRDGIPPPAAAETGEGQTPGAWSEGNHFGPAGSADHGNRPQNMKSGSTAGWRMPVITPAPGRSATPGRRGTTYPQDSPNSRPARRASLLGNLRRGSRCPRGADHSRSDSCRHPPLIERSLAEVPGADLMISIRTDIPAHVGGMGLAKDMSRIYADEVA